VAYFIKKEAVKQWEVALPEDKDYQTHAAEIKIQNLEWGMYMVLAANTPDFDYENNVVAYSMFIVSNIAYINRTRSDKGLEFYLVDRDTGQPLKNASVQVWERTYNRQEDTCRKMEKPLMRIKTVILISLLARKKIITFTWSLSMEMERTACLSIAISAYIDLTIAIRNKHELFSLLIEPFTDRGRRFILKALCYK
jgi:hypothetical protein